MPGIMQSRTLILIHVTISIITMLKTSSVVEAGILYPHASETRTILSLDGLWNFRVAPENDSAIGYREKWYKQELKKTGPVILMPVPASYNDITVDKSIRDHVGVVWYDTDYYVPKEWSSKSHRVWLRFGSVHYSADVYVNGEPAVSHTGGHVPFETEISSFVKFGTKNLFTVAVNNTLTDITVPQGELQKLKTDSGMKVIQTYSFDFFNYAGIHRQVSLYTTPATYIDDISITTDVSSTGNTGIINYDVHINGNDSGNGDISVNLLDKDGNYVIRDVHGVKGQLNVPEAKLWWPYLMDEEPGYLYTFEVHLMNSSDGNDIYRLPVGIRKLEWNNNSFSINGRHIYLRGFGRHEDSDIRGKGLDFPLIARDYSLIKWIGANAYRTSHYPYSEEIMDLADREGIMVIDECPGVNIGQFGFKSELLEAHKKSLSELYLRDKNRPSVIMWSVANEARTTKKEADKYFKSIAVHMKSLDSSRPVTMAINAGVDKDLAGQYMDIIAFNKYNGWYENAGRTDTIITNIEEEAHAWHKLHGKPVMITEYGADSIDGIHYAPDIMWSEEYQTDLFSKHFIAFDKLRKETFFVGEMLWNFADFMTAQNVYRAAGNHKGILTRSRQPKAAAFLTRKRYWTLAQELDNVEPPEDLQEYFCSREEHVAEVFEEYSVVSVRSDIRN